MSTQSLDDVDGHRAGHSEVKEIVSGLAIVYAVTITAMLTLGIAVKLQTDHVAPPTAPIDAGAYTP